MTNEPNEFSEEFNQQFTEDSASESSASGESTEDKSFLHSFVDHQRKAAEEAAKALEALIPPDFRTHGRAAREEFLTSFKVLIDGASAAVERELNRMQSDKGNDSGSSGPSTTGKTKVKVEVS